MDVYSTGLSLVLGRVLSAWCEQVKPPDIERYLEFGGFQGFWRVADMTPQDVIAELRSSGLRDRRSLGEPVYLSWQRFQSRHEPGVLVVDATHYDDRSQSGNFLLSNNPFGLIEGLLIAAMACDVSRCRLLLPAGLHDFESGLLNALEIIEERNLSSGRQLDLELIRDPVPSILSGDFPYSNQEPALVHHLETWYHLALVFSLGAAHYKTLGLEGQTGTYLITVGGKVKRPGLVEAPMGVKLWHVIEALTGGPESSISPLALSLDDGMGGFLSVSTAQIPMAPEEMGSAGVSPAPMTIWLLEEDTCMVDMAQKALYRFWLLSEPMEGSEIRRLIARVTRMVTEITVGKGRKSHISELENLGRVMAGLGVAASRPLLSSLTYFHDQWLNHINGEGCPSGRCLKHRPAPCHNTCPAGIDIPSFIGLIGHGQYRTSAQVIAMDNPLLYTCGLVCPAPCENSCLRGKMDDAIHIRAMKAVAAKHAFAAGGYPAPRKIRASGKRVAIVGSGPAGLTAAYFLNRKGHEVTIFEAQKEAGGMLRYGIPAYRLPREVLDLEVGRITKLGVKIETGLEIKHLDELKDQGFDAIFLALGTQVSRMIPIEGTDLPFVLGGLEFLKKVRGDENPRVGPRVIVVGGAMWPSM